MAHGGARPGSGRPKGAKDKATKEMGATLAELAREHTAEALETYLRVMRSGDAPPAAQVAAASAILDRGYGRPPQALEHTGKDGGPIESIGPTDPRELAKAIVSVLASAKAAG